MKKHSILGPALAFLASLSAACSGTGEPGGDEVVLGLIAPFTRNPPAVDGAQLAADEINAAGGIEIQGRRRHLELLTEDDAGEPEKAISKALQLIRSHRAAALLGVPRSYNAIPVSRIAEQYETPLVTTMSTHPETTAGKRFVFRLAFVDDFQGRALADFAYHELGARRAACLVDEVGPYNTYLAGVFNEVFRGHGGEIVAFEMFTEDELQVPEQLRRIRESGAEVLFMPNTHRFVILHASQARASGFQGEFLGSDSWSHGIDFQNHPELYGANFSDLWAPDRPGERARAFITSYRQSFQTEPTASAALSYDAVMMIAEAIRRGGSDDRRVIRDELANMRAFDGVSGIIGYRHGTGDPSRSVFIRKIEDDGQVRLYREIEP